MRVLWGETRNPSSQLLPEVMMKTSVPLLVILGTSTTSMVLV